MELILTKQKLIEWEHCYSAEDFERVTDVIFAKSASVSVREFLELDLKIFNNPEDLFWVILRTELVPEKLLHEVAIYCAEKVLPLFETEYPGDMRPRDAIETMKRRLRGEASDAEFAEAREAAWDAADRGEELSVDLTAARAAAWDAARAAARAAEAVSIDYLTNAIAAEAARAAAWDAARAAARAAEAAAEAAARAAEAREAAWEELREWMKGRIND